MKNINIKFKLLFSLFTLIFLLFSCQEVVQVDLETGKPKLVIEAFINWQKGTTGAQQKIKLTTTSSYYSNDKPIASGASVVITSGSTTYTFIENVGTGEYICNNFIPTLNQTYTLTINYNGANYSATETLKPVTPIVAVIQENNGGLSGTDIRLRTTFVDPGNEENYYLINYNYSNRPKPDYYVIDDLFFNGNPYFSITFGGGNEEKLKTGDVVKVTHYGISKQYNNFMELLLANSGNAGGAGPFSTAPATVRGNIKNNTNEADFPFGYFSLSEADTRTYTIL